MTRNIRAKAFKIGKQLRRRWEINFTPNDFFLGGKSLIKEFSQQQQQLTDKETFRRLKGGRQSTSLAMGSWIKNY